MSATILERRGTWPTMDEIEVVTDAFRQAYNLLDELNLRCYGLVDKDMVWEPVEGIPTPTLENVGALTFLHMELDSLDEGQKEWRDWLRQLRDSASNLEAVARRKRDK